MSHTYVHLSDIHFGQDTGAEVVIHNDVRDCLIDDVSMLSKSWQHDRIRGVIVTGDIAFSGKEHEYDDAGIWLDKLTDAIGCERASVIIIPGNHDVDRGNVSAACSLIMNDLVSRGYEHLDDFLEDPADCDVLYQRFSNYRAFADAYSCPLDREGRWSSAHRIEIAPGKHLSFVSLNSALLSSDNDRLGNLVLGARQRTIPRRPNEEIVVLCHHPLEWLQDCDEARHYLYNRARVFIHGHTHEPSARVTQTPGGHDFLMISAGAVVPPPSHEGYTFSYNLISFHWDHDDNGLRVTILPRSWDAAVMHFVRDTKHFNNVDSPVVLRCPPFSVRVPETTRRETGVPIDDVGSKETLSYDRELTGGDAMDNFSRMIRLRFFRDLTTSQRTQIFIRLRTLPEDWGEELTHNIQHQLLRNILISGRQAELEEAIEDVAAQTQHGSVSPT